MTVNLDTGSIQSFSLKIQPSDGAIVSDGTAPSEVVVYPSENKRLLLVGKGEMVVITGYELKPNTKVYFSKVLRSYGTPPNSDNTCCPKVTQSKSITLMRAAIPCWTLTPCNPIFVIKTPGSYEIDVFGDNADVVITATHYPIQEVNTQACECKAPDKIDEPLPPSGSDDDYYYPDK